MLREQMMKIEKESKGMAANYAAEKQRMEVKMREMEQEAKKEREGVEAEYKQQLADLDRRLRDADDASVADRAKLEEMRRHHAALKAEDEEVGRLGEEIGNIKGGLGEMASKYATDKAMMEAKMNEMDQEAKERERTEADHHRQLTELNYRLRDTANTSAADQAKLKEEVKRLQDRVVPTPYVRILLHLAIHNSQCVHSPPPHHLSARVPPLMLMCVPESPLPC